MGDDHGVCNTRLELGIGLDNFVPKRKNLPQQQQKKKTNKSVICLDLSFPFHHEKIGCKTEEEGSSSKTINGEQEEEERQSDTTSNNNMNNFDQIDDDDNNGGHITKKLRLTKQQSTVLQDTFKHHTTLNMAQKQALAEKLKLKPRQVEVWFQNRRARTKLKKTEVDCEFLKKCCENLIEENRRLKKQLQELRSSTPLFVQLQKSEATIAVCPSSDMKMVRLTKGSHIVKHERSTAAAAARICSRGPQD